MILAERDLRAHLDSERDQLRDSLKGFVSDRVLGAVFAIPREDFVDPMQRFDAYEDEAQSIPGYEEEASISQPSTVAKMIELLDPQPSDFVVEVGTATGYQAAILSRLVRHVVTLEILPELAEAATKRLHKLGVGNVEVMSIDANADMTLPEQADKLIITASVFPSANLPLYNLVKEGGTIVVPVGGVVGEKNFCNLVRMQKTKDGLKLERIIPEYNFVPMEGDYGWTRYLTTIIQAHNKWFYEDLMKATFPATEEPPESAWFPPSQ